MSRENVTEAEKRVEVILAMLFRGTCLKFQDSYISFVHVIPRSISHRLSTYSPHSLPSSPRYTGIVARNASISASYKSRMDFRLAAFLSLCVSGIRGWNKR